MTTLDRAAIRPLVRQVDVAYLKALVRSEPSEGFELLLGEDVASLWFAGRRLAGVSTKSA